MITEYLQAALERAHYEIIEDEEPFYGEVRELPGVYATGKTLEECRANLSEVVEEWVVLSISRNLSIPEINGRTVKLPDNSAV
jgi:predicted RNase H-like HicB family nuclease